MNFKYIKYEEKDPKFKKRFRQESSRRERAKRATHLCIFFGRLSYSCFPPHSLFVILYVMNGYVLLLISILKDHILGLREQEKRRLREKFEFLENGIWDAGVRVKKLRETSNKVIFEARLSRDQRLLFTLGRHGEKTAVYVWGIVRHEDVSSAARNILPANTPFLLFEPQEKEELPEVVMDDLSPEYYSQETIEEKTPEDYGPQKWLVLSDKEWRRLLLSGGTENFEIHLLYVAVTRARNTLVIYDGNDPSDVWDVEVLGDALYRTGDYINAAKLFEKAGMRADLIRCYEKIKYNCAVALIYEKSKDIAKPISQGNLRGLPQAGEK